VLTAGKTVLAVRKVSPNTPQIMLSPFGDKVLKGSRKIAWKAFDADGDPLTFSVDYSADAGTTWLPVLSGLSGPTAVVDFDSLPGSDRAMLRVTATDGFNTAESRSESLFVGRKGPVITVYPSTAEAVLQAGQNVTADATAFDWEDGPVTNVASYVWTSSIDGLLGVGPWIHLRKLTPGKHAVTVAVTDSDKNISRKTLVVNVLGQSKGK
jgi:hypothetical protein